MADMTLDMNSPKGRRQSYEMRYGMLKNERESFVAHWKDLSKYIVPRRGRFFVTDRNDGSASEYNSIYDNTATVALRTLVAGMMSGITSPARPWFRLATPDPMMMDFQPVKEWLYSVENLMRMIFNKSNFYNSLHVLYEELALFGTASMLIDEDFNDAIRCYNMTAGEYCLGLDERLAVNSIYREYSLSVWQVVERFGIDNVSMTTRQAYERGQYDSWVAVMHVIQPNIDYKEGAIGRKGKPYMSCHYEKELGDGDENIFLAEGGYFEQPVVAPRWGIRGSDIYGDRCPAMEALGDVKQLQFETSRKSEAIDKLVDPPLQAPPQLKNQTWSTLAGGVTFVDQTQLQGGFRPVYEVNPRLNEMMMDIADVQRRINDAFYVDLFRMLSLTDRREITAREVEEKHEEKLLMLGPVLERLHNELLDPIIDRVFGIMIRNEMLPPPPPEIAGADLRVEYISVLAQAQRAVGIGSIERLSGFVGGLAQMNPEVMMKFDFDQAVDEYSNMIGVPPSLLVSDEDVAAKRQAQNEIQARDRMIGETQAAMATAKDMADTPTDTPSMLSDYLAR